MRSYKHDVVTFLSHRSATVTTHFSSPLNGKAVFFPNRLSSFLLKPQFTNSSSSKLPALSAFKIPQSSCLSYISGSLEIFCCSPQLVGVEGLSRAYFFPLIHWQCQPQSSSYELNVHLVPHLFLQDLFTS